MSLPSNVILIGFMGAGKTVTGKELAKFLNFEFFDTDQWIEEKNGMKVTDIFHKEGEAFFRQEEKNVLNLIQIKNRCVISTGGGIWIDNGNRDRLKKMGWCVWLKVTARKSWQRLGSNLVLRPIISKAENPYQTMENLIFQRNQIYSLADAFVDTDEDVPVGVANKILKLLIEDHPFDMPKLQK